MSSPLYNAFGNQPQNDMIGVIKRFQNFKRTFQGDPKQEVMKMLTNGSINQQELNQFQQMAQALSGILK